MYWIEIAVLALCLIMIAVQDIKSRQIHIVLPVLVFASSLALTVYKSGFVTTAKIILYNTVFLAITIIILTIYMSFKNKAYLNPFKNYFGLGDLLFYIAATPLFYLSNYVIYFILSMIFAIAMQLIFGKIIKDKTVPLAGFASVLLITIIGTDIVLSSCSLTLI